MSKQKGKRHINNKKKKKTNKLKSNPNTGVTSLSKREVSGNWLAFKKSTGCTGKLFSVNKTVIEKKKVCKMEEKLSVTKVLALDCEMVSDLNDDDMLARVSLVNYKLECIYDKFVKPVSKVGDFRTRFSGIRQEDIENGVDFDTVQKEVKTLLFNKILVGHALHNDFKVLKFGHHKQLIRDTSRYGPFKEVSDSKSPSLKKLAKVFLDENVQEGEHNSIEDARTAMKLYKKFRRDWEISLVNSKSKTLEGPQLNSEEVEV